MTPEQLKLRFKTWFKHLLVAHGLVAIFTVVYWFWWPIWFTPRTGCRSEYIEGLGHVVTSCADVFGFDFPYDIGSLFGAAAALIIILFWSYSLVLLLVTFWQNRPRIS